MVEHGCRTRAGREMALATRALCMVLTATAMLTTGCSKGTEPTIAQDFVLTNGVLIDGTGAPSRSGAVLVVRDGRISALGRQGEIEIPGGLPSFDLGGRTILPGFINAHVHEGFNEEHLRAWASAGVTSVRDLCGPSSFSLRDQYALDLNLARLIAAGPMVSVPGGYPAVPWGSSNMLPVNSPEDARTKVRELLQSGADLVKIAIESGSSFSMQIPTLSSEEAAAIVQTAHGHATRVSAHVLVARDLRDALAAGVDDIAHMVVDDLPDSLIHKMVTEDAYWVPTIELWKNVDQGLGNLAIGNLRRFVVAGGKVALGTDYAGYDRPFQLGMPIKEMEWMLEAGMTPMQVFVAGTKNAAHVCNREQDLGTLEVGKIADLLVVTGDPLQDIGALSNVYMVFHNGERIR